MKALRMVLRLNAASCLIFGLIFVVAGAEVAGFLGEAPAGLVRIVGALLFVNGLHLLIASFRSRAWAWEVLYFSAGDIAWFVATLALLGGGVLVTTAAGQLAALVMGVGVLGMGMTQAWLLAEATGSGRPGDDEAERESDLLPAGYSRLGAIGASWMAMKLWVKVWLFALNGIFLAAIAFWPEPAAKLTLAAYVATGPLLFAYMAVQRGLTRVLGVAHLAPWVPLAGYLVMRLTGEGAGPRVTFGDAPGLFVYVLALLGMVGVCLAFDVYDVIRWFRGERYRLGSPTAAALGASMSRRGLGSENAERL